MGEGERIAERMGNLGRISIGQFETNNHRKITNEGKKFTTNGGCLV